MQLAALDLGSNSFHLLVARSRENLDFEELGSKRQVLGLGSVVQEHGELTETAFAAALDAVGRLAEHAESLGAEKLLTVATSALRDARNGRAFLDACYFGCGVDIELLSGDDEARLAYLGARSALPLTRGRVVVADIGGGSVELAAGETESSDQVESLPLGFLRLGKSFDLRAHTGLSELKQHVELECRRARKRIGHFDTLVLSGGTARALGKQIGGGVAGIATSQLTSLCRELSSLSPAALVARGVDSTRARSLPIGALVIAGLIEGLGHDQLRISPRGLREGVLLRELSRLRQSALEPSRVRRARARLPSLIA